MDNYIEHRADGQLMSIRVYYHLLRRDVTNLSFLRHRIFYGFIVTMHQSGTHWLKHMLATAISRELDIPPPKFSYAPDMIGGPRDAKMYPGIRPFGHSHTIPSFLISFKILHRLFKLPRYVVVVRDLRSMLVSHYEKYKAEYGCEFSEYLRGDITNRRFDSDIWWCIRYLNAWGRAIAGHPEDFIVVRYEDLTTDTLGELEKINSFLGLNLSEHSLRYGVQESTKEKMNAKPRKPAHKLGHKRIAIKMDSTPHQALFTEADQEFFRGTCRNYLVYNFGYQY